MATNSIGSAALILSTSYGGMIQGLGGAADAVQGWGAKLQSTLFKLSASMSTSLGLLGLPPETTAQISEAIDKLNNASRSSKRFGLSAADYLGVQFAAEQTGVDVDVLNKGLNKLVLHMAEAAGGNDTAMNSFRMLGLSMEDVKGMDMLSMLDLVATKMQSMGNTGEKLMILNELFDARSGMKFLTMLNKGGDGLKALREQAKTSGVANVTDEQALSAEKLKIAWFDLKSAASGVFVQLAVGFAPVMSKIASGLMTVWTTFQPILAATGAWLNSAWDKVSAALTPLAPILLQLAQIIGGLVVATYSWKAAIGLVNYLGTAFTAAGAMAMPLLGILGSFGGQLAAVNTATGSWLYGTFVAGLSAVGTAFSTPMATITGLWGGVASAGSSAWSTIASAVSSGFSGAIGLAGSAMGGLSAVFGTVVGAVTNPMATLNGLWGMLKDGIAAVGNTVLSLGRLILMNPIFLLAAIIIAIIAAIVDWSDVMDVLSAAWEIIKKIAIAVLYGIAVGISFVIDAVKMVAGFMMKYMVAPFISFISLLVAGIKKLLQAASYIPGLGDLESAASAMQDIENRLDTAAAKAKSRGDDLMGTRFGDSKKQVDEFFDNFERRRQQAADKKRQDELQAALQGDLNKYMTELDTAIRQIGMTDEQKKLDEFRQKGARAVDLVGVTIRQQALISGRMMNELENAIRQFGMTDNEKKIADFVKNGGSPVMAQDIQKKMDKLQALQLDWDADPTKKMNKEMTNLDRLLKSGAISWEVYQFHANKALTEAENALGIGGEAKTAAAAFKGSKESTEAILKHQMKTVADLSPQERMIRIANEQKNLMKQNNDQNNVLLKQLRDGQFLRF